MQRGKLRIYLGAAPGAGTTYAMLEEAHQLQEQGSDVVIGLAADHGRAETAALKAGLDSVPPRIVEYRGSAAEEPDVDALIARAPGVALIDDYAHGCLPGSRHEKRWQDIEEVLDAGIDVVSTVDIRHLGSLSDVVAAITGVRQDETVPDDLVRRADQIELVDIAPEMLRQRLSLGKVYPPEQIDAALSNYFRLGNLTALRELALLWLADRVEEGLEAYRAQEGISDTWPARERLVVGLSGGPEGQVLLRRAARILSRVTGGELHAVHVSTADGLAAGSPRELEQQRQLTKELGGTYHAVTGEDPAETLLDFARSINATQIVVGVSRRSPVARLWGGRGIGARVVQESGDIDVHMVSHTHRGRGTGHTPPTDLGRARTRAGAAMAILLPPLLQLILGAIPDEHFATDMLIQLCGTIAVALLGGLWPAIVAAAIASMTVTFFAVPPTGTLAIGKPENVLTLVLFLAVAAVVSLVVDYSARLAKEAGRVRAEAAILDEVSRGVLAAEDSVAGFLDQVRELFRVDGAALYVRGPDPDGRGPWELAAKSGTAPADPADAGTLEPVDDDHLLALTGRTLSQRERQLLAAVTSHLLAIQQHEQLAASRRENLRLAEGNKMRTSVLRAVSHDLRTPLAGIKLAVSSLRQDSVRLPPEDEQELLATIESYADRLDSLVGNLLDMSRITAESVQPLLHPLSWREAVEAALATFPPGRIRVELAPNLPPVDADAGLLERVIANIIENALKYAADSDIVIVASVGGVGAATVNGRPASELRIIDHGQGVPAARVVDMFRPFQRLDDVSSGTGVGLGLAVAKGFTETMGGRLLAEPTPGGGLTMIIRLPLSAGGAGD
ncbi:ATP-binding protein [Arthrobacter sp. GCM10027362]|uniref:ATP-binding protein n=1 Tax=Arthrobacter sp. GCM10027362 TaxID=3273379 RepID=UPI00362FE13F